MRKISFLLFMAVFVINSHSQVIKLENGTSFSWTNYASQANMNYSGALSVDYLERKCFMLNSKLSFFRRSETSVMEMTPKNKLDVVIDYISISTTTRFKQPFKSGGFFIGVGPSVDFKLNSEYEIERATNDNSHKKGEFMSSDQVFSFLSEIGYFIDVTKWRVELNVAYRNNLTKVNTETRKGFISHMLTFSIGVGYIF